MKLFRRSTTQTPVPQPSAVDMGYSNSAVHNFISFPAPSIKARTMTPIRPGYASDIRAASQ